MEKCFIIFPILRNASLSKKVQIIMFAYGDSRTHTAYTTKT
jgi:hypothetical protein